MIIGLWLIILIEAIPLGWLVYDKFKRPKELGLSTPHVLRKIYFKKSSYSIDTGWVWLCTCGTHKLITEAYDGGTEAKAIRGWKEHRDLHGQLSIEAGGNEFEKKYRALEAEFASFKESCYCKESNDDLIMLERDNKQW